MPTNASQTEPHGTGTGEQLVTPTSEGHARRSRGRPVCGQCHKSFGRTQEFKRHERDIHSPPRQCPFCSAKWTRPDRIKSHLIATHKERFTPEILREVDALRGRRLVEFLDRLTYANLKSASDVIPEATRTAINCHGVSSTRAASFPPSDRPRTPATASSSPSLCLP
jgi:hypothetical protein